MWSLGCILYELLTGNILFDIDDIDEYKENQTRIHLYYIINTCGMLPQHMIEKSNNIIFFTKDLKYIKCNHEFDTLKSIIKQIKKICVKKNIENEYEILLLDFILQLLAIDPQDRISSESALQHPIFKF